MSEEASIEALRGRSAAFSLDSDRSPGPKDTRPSVAAIVTRSAYQMREKETRVFFTRRELDRILSIYGRMVQSGEWRDYAIDDLKDRAVFSVYRRSSEIPLFRIEKRPRDARRQGAFSVIGGMGQILKRGHELEAVLRIFDKKKLRLVR